MLNELFSWWYQLLCTEINHESQLFRDRIHGQKHRFEICLLSLAFLANTAMLMSLDNELFMKQRVGKKVPLTICQRKKPISC